MPHTLRFGSLNTWSGSAEGFLPFFEKMVKQFDHLSAQEVHQATHEAVPRLIMPKHPGDRPGPIRAHLATELAGHMPAHFVATFAAHVDGCHDNERDDRLKFGQWSGVNTTTFAVKAVETGFIFGQHNQYNDEGNGGEPCGKVAIGHLLQHHDSGSFIAVINVHGFWSRWGKVDMLERFAQNKGINQLIEKLRDHARHDPVHIIVIGDLNYTSRMVALYDLAQQPAFGSGGGVILNHQYGIKESRTNHYKKPLREADFAIVSQSFLPHVRGFRILLDDVPSDHGLLEITVEL